eukprot:5512995-Alexandrium_andersonii.AAC.1
MSASLVGSEDVYKRQVLPLSLLLPVPAPSAARCLRVERELHARPLGSTCLLYTSDAADDM